MITLEQKEKFIDLRSDGNSYDLIAKKMKIGKSTCLKLGTELKKKINNATYFKIQTILEKYKLNQLSKIESHVKLLRKTIDEIDKRNLSELGIKDLLALKENLESSLKKELKIKYVTYEPKNQVFNDSDMEQLEL